MSCTVDTRLGIDVGSLYLKIVRIDSDGKVGPTTYRAHQGYPIRCLREELPKYLTGNSTAVGFTGALAGNFSESLRIRPIENESSIISAVRQKMPEARNIIDIGGDTLTLIRLNASGELEGITRNSLCAAGTGSFLDEQAGRLDISYHNLDRFPQIEDPPLIATRCAVFAKSDLIHHQQTGRSKIECWIGLCQGMVRTVLNTLLKGRSLEGLTVVVGGVSRNPEIMRRLKRIYGDQIIRFEDGHLSGAYGAALLAEERIHAEQFEMIETQNHRVNRGALITRPPLKLNYSYYPSWEVEECCTDRHQNEIRVTRTPQTRVVQCYLGVDVGSTSTKLAVIDRNGEVICDVYRKTAGDPIGATQKLFDALLNLSRSKGFKFKVNGCVTTGSGRKMVGMVIGADRIINEITCHVKGTMHVDPEIDTIFEIGGQDSKYMRTHNGKIIDAAMNYVCAAGTGSFVEEQARRLGYSVQDIGDAVMGLTPPHTSDRCTVFMEQDVNRLLRAGYTKEEVLAAMMYSVVQNYLNKVVGHRSYSQKKIFFQGATARNPGLVAAFENILNTEMIVSPYAHVMGAWGAALLAERLKEIEGNRTRFRGLDLSRREVNLKTDRCRMCANNCEITYAQIEGTNEETSWGYLCGREPGDKKARSNPHFRLFKLRDELLAGIGKVKLPAGALKIAVPRSLTSYTYMPLWRRFFGELGYNVLFSPPTNEEIKKLGAEITGGEFCFPIKAALGHVRWLAEREDVEKIFIPHMVSAPPNSYTTNSYFCSYVQSFPSLIRSSLELNEINTSRLSTDAGTRLTPDEDTKLLTPVIDFRWKASHQVRELYNKLGTALRRDKERIKKAWEAGCAAYLEFQEACRREGEKVLKVIETEENPAILILGRPYNIFDSGVNLGLVRKIAELGYTVIPLDFIPGDPAGPGEVFRNIYWNYAQKIIQAIRKIRENDRIFPVYLTNFNCGPDSFIESYAYHLVGEKQMLVLELDEHDADAGYITRIEAFLDVVKSASPVRSFPEILLPPSTDKEFRRRTIWIPKLHPVSAPLFAAAFRSFGYRAEVLPLETDESFEIGRHLTQGRECLPIVTTIGAFVKKLREIHAKPGEHAYFMSTASGPCRFGQYALKDRMILNELGYTDIPILSPSTLNSYQGLPEKLRRKVWKYVVASDILMKLRCKKRPYALDQSLVLKIFEEGIAHLVDAVESGKNFEKAFEQSLNRLASIEQSEDPKPLVGIVGEIYVRCNAFTNEDVIESIERYGGETWLAPVSEWFLYTAYLQKWRAQQNLGGLVYRSLSNLKNRYMMGVERKMYRLASRWMHDRREPDIEDILNAGRKFLPLNFEGESILTIGRTIEFIRNGVAMVVNCAPFGCMPGTITSALLQKIQNQTGVPVVSIFYDGEGDLNNILGIYLHQILHS